jgi:DNA replication initiation complex subunit (GINS family)
MGPSGPAPAPPEAAAPQESVEDWVDRAITEAHGKAAEGGLTPKERLLVEKLTSLYAQLLAERDKEEQAALGGGPATNFLRRNSGG